MEAFEVIAGGSFNGFAVPAHVPGFLMLADELGYTFIDRSDWAKIGKDRQVTKSQVKGPESMLELIQCLKIGKDLQAPSIQDLV